MNSGISHHSASKNDALDRAPVSYGAKTPSREPAPFATAAPSTVSSWLQAPIAYLASATTLVAERASPRLGMITSVSRKPRPTMPAAHQNAVVSPWCRRAVSRYPSLRINSVSG
jgi:hypothetical protein